VKGEHFGGDYIGDISSDKSGEVVYQNEE